MKIMGTMVGALVTLVLVTGTRDATKKCVTEEDDELNWDQAQSMAEKIAIAS